ncbi:MAG: hypothetical protein OXN89_01020 [Bryobacterales bacterium]|nr:hypothetical protein [Bryobacterales bacterium]
MSSGQRSPVELVALEDHDWPSHVKTVTFNDLGCLGVSEKDRTLYWNGRAVRTRTRLSLTGWQTGIAIIAALGSFASGLVAVLEYLG